MKYSYLHNKTGRYETIYDEYSTEPDSDGRHAENKEEWQTDANSRRSSRFQTDIFRNLQ